MLEELTERIRAIDFNRILDEVLESEKTFILDLIRSQLIKGETGKGVLGTYSNSDISKFYVDKKYNMGLFKGDSFPNYDLFYSGDLHMSLIVDIRKEFIRIEFTDPKTPLVEESTNMDLNSDESDVLTLNEENLELLRQKIKPIIQKKINDYFGI